MWKQSLVNIDVFQQTIRKNETQFLSEEKKTD
jgi:hypothetical protein